jgi:signal transduction histidine kinase
MIRTSRESPGISAPTLAGQAGHPAHTDDALRDFRAARGRLETSHEELLLETSRLREQLREALEQVDRSRRLSLLGESAAGIVHDVRNPLSSIRLYARMLVDELESDRPDQAGLAPKQEIVDVEELLAGAVEVCGGVQDETGLGEPAHEGVRVRWSRSPGAPHEIAGDAGLLRRALVNVMRNAMEAVSACGDGGGAVDVSAVPARFMTRGGRAPGVALRVRDTGPGVCEAVRARMFAPFFTTKGNGTGLGLAIVRGVVEAHGGSVRVRNNETGGGACVELLLPVRCGMDDAGNAGGGRGGVGGGSRSGRRGA